MSKLIKITILILVVLSVTFSTLFYFDLWPFSKRQTSLTSEKNTSENVVDSEITSEAIDSSSSSPSSEVSSPCVILDDEYCSQGELVYDDGQLIGLGFILPERSKIYAPFKGLYEGGEETLVEINNRHYPTFDLMDVTKDDWGQQDIQTFFFAIGSHKLAIEEGEEAKIEKGQLFASAGSLIIMNSFGESLGDYNLILTFRDVNIKTGEWSDNPELLKEFFNYID